MIHERAIVTCAGTVHSTAIIRQFCNIYDSTIGKGTKVGAYTEIGGATIGENCIIGAKVFIPPGVTIEDNVFIGPGTVFTNDRWPRAGEGWELRETVVKSAASIGANCTVLSGLTIGHFAMIGAGSIVSRDVPAKAIVKMQAASHYCRECHPRHS